MGQAHLVIEGFIAKEPEIKFSVAGKPMVNISIAHNVGKREENKPPIWFNIKAVGSAGEQLQHAHKGDKIEISKCMPDEWTDKNGNKRLSWVAFDVKILTSTNHASTPPPPNDTPPLTDDDVPF